MQLLLKTNYLLYIQLLPSQKYSLLWEINVVKTVKEMYKLRYQVPLLERCVFSRKIQISIEI